MKILKISINSPSITGHRANIIQALIIDNNEQYNITYYEDMENKGMEIYKGENYVLNSTKKSYSRNYSCNEIPKKYKEISLKLKEIHKIIF